MTLPLTEPGGGTKDDTLSLPGVSQRPKGVGRHQYTKKQTKGSDTGPKDPRHEATEEKKVEEPLSQTAVARSSF